MLVKRTVLLLSLLALLVLPGRAVLAAKGEAEPIDLEKLSYRGVIPGTSTPNQAIALLGEPSERRMRLLLIYRELSAYIENSREHDVVAGVYLILAPSPDVLGAPSLYGLKGDAKVAALLRKLYPYKRISALPGVSKATPAGWEILRVSREGRTASFAFDAADHTLLQLSVTED